MRTVLVLDENQQARSRFLHNRTPFPVCPVRSMISPRLLGKPAVSFFPRTSEEVVQVQQMLRRLNYMRRTINRFRNSPSEFQALDFFEYVIQCRMEHSFSFHL